MKWPFSKSKKVDPAAPGTPGADTPAPPAKPAKTGKAAKAGKVGKGQPVLEYLPDADEIERSPVPRIAQFTLHLLIVAMVLFFVWASVSELDEVVTAPGKLSSPLPNVVVQPLETAIVQTIAVRAGQVVKKGDTLATLDSTFAQADESQLQNRLNSLETQIQSLQAELSGTTEKAQTPQTPDQQLQASLSVERRANYRAQQDRLQENMARTRAALQTNRKDQGMVQSRLRSVKEIEAMQEKMVAQKYGAPLQLLEAQQRTKEVERELEQTTSREQELKREYAALEAEKLGFEKNWRQKSLEELLSVTRERDALTQQIQKADKRNQLVTLTAPVDAVVLEVAKLSPGSIVQGAETFFTLVPLGTMLEAEVKINSMDIGHIKPGDEVKLKLDAFPFQRHGTLPGAVRMISEDAFKRDANAAASNEAYYVSRIKLEGTDLKNMPDGAKLLPGMTLSAEIVVGKRSVLSYMAWPLMKGLDEAGKEP